jgi:hypothetical protein
VPELPNGRLAIGAVDAASARAALADVVPRLTALVRSVRSPANQALGQWSAADVAVHLTHVWQVLPALYRGNLDSPIADLSELASFTTTLVSDEPARDLQAAASQIEQAAAAYLAAPIPDDGPRPWLVKGTQLPASAFSCHLLSESLVHGYDIARADGRRWRIEPEHAAKAIMGFMLPALSVVDPHFPVDQRKAAGVRACMEVRLWRTGRFFMVLNEGMLRVEPTAGGSVDWHVSADPATLFLLFWSRTSQWPALLSGRLRGWGRRPLLGMRLPRMLRNP